MSNFMKQILLQCRAPFVQTKRYRGKINIQRPRKPHYERAKLLAATQVQLPEKPKTNTCFQSTKERYGVDVESPYNAIIAREVRNWLDHSRTVGFFHMNSIIAEDVFTVRVKLHKQNLHLKSYGKKIIRQAVEGSRFEAIMPLFESSHCMVFSTEQRVPQLVRITRRVPQLILLGGIFEGKLLSRKEFLELAAMPSLPIVQAGLVNTINMAACHLVKQLETHQNNFVNVLDVYAKSSEDSGSVEEKQSEACAGETTQITDSKETQ